MNEIEQKYHNLLANLKQHDRIAIAFSGGVDSTFLLAAAQSGLGDGAVAVTADSVFIPREELEASAQFCSEHGIRQIVFEADVLHDSEICANPANRCYLCKLKIFRRMQTLTNEQGIAAVAEGSNLDDSGDYRPGMQAIAELGILSPLRDALLTKQEIRTLSRSLGLPTWQKPSAACLASRIPYGDVITAENLHMAEEAEQYLHQLGLRQVRVRIHGRIARIEALPDDLMNILHHRIPISARFHEIGFQYTSLDLLGYRTGSLNEVL